MIERPRTLTADEFIAAKSAQFARERAASRLLPMKDIERKGVHEWQREAWTFLVQHDIPTKVFSVERLRFAGWRGARSAVHAEGSYAEPLVYRFGYWVVA